MDKIPFIEKYRPQTPELIIHHDKIKEALDNYMQCSNLPNLLFTGYSGIGKTTMITAFAKKYYGENYENMTLIINASENRGIDAIKGIVNQFAITKDLIQNTSNLKFKLIIMDEIDSMTIDAQEILRKVIEIYSSSVRFCLICNYLKKISPSIQSRCIILKFKPIPLDELKIYVKEICIKENIYISKDSINLIINYCNGDLRKLLNIIQSLKMNMNYMDDKTKIEISHVSKILLCPNVNEVKELLKFIKLNDLYNSIEYIKNLILENDYSLNEIINMTYNILMNNLMNNDEELFTMEETFQYVRKICQINESLCFTNKEDIQCCSFISVFYIK